MYRLLALLALANEKINDLFLAEQLAGPSQTKQAWLNALPEKVIASGDSRSIISRAPRKIAHSARQLASPGEV